MNSLVPITFLKQKELIIALLFSFLWNTETYAQTTLFSTGYDGTTEIDDPEDTEDNRQDFTGADNGYDWNEDVPDYENNLPDIWVQNGLTEEPVGEEDYIMITDDMRAFIVEDPLDSENNVLKFQILNHNGSNGRVQTNVRYHKDYRFTGPNYQSGLKYIHYTTRLFIPDDFGWMLESGETGSEYNFMTLAEFFNSESDDYENGNSFRISLNLHKKSGDNFFLLRVKGEPYAVTGWGSENWEEFSDEKIGKVSSGLDFELNQWLNLDVTLIEGDDNNGRFILKINSTTIFNITNRTHHEFDHIKDGFHHIMPQKLYTRDPVVKKFNDNNAVLHVFWDDFTLEYVPVNPNFVCRIIADGGDDAVENYSNNSVNLNDLDLDIGRHYVGLQFSGFTIPENALITNSFLQFEAKNNFSADPSIVDIFGEFGEFGDSPDEFSDTPGDISGRLGSSTDGVDWHNIPHWVQGDVVGTPDLTENIISPIRDYYHGIEPNDIISIILDPTPSGPQDQCCLRRAHSEESGSGPPPRLCINYVNQVIGTIEALCGPNPNEVPGILVKMTPTNSDPCPDEYIAYPDQEGNYSHPICGQGVEYTISPRKTNEPNCGLTVMDLALLRRYIIHNDYNDFELPASRIAADVNFDGTINNADYSLIWSAIYKTPTSIYALNVPWVFIADDGDFEDPGNPAVPTYNKYVTDVFPDDNPANFFIKKMGDVDCDCVPGEPWKSPYVEPAPQKVKLTFTDSHYDQNDIVNLNFEVEDFENITAYQIGLAFDHNHLEFLGASAGELNHVSVASNFDLGEIGDGIIRTIWVYEATDTINTDTTLTNGSNIFNFTFKALDNIASIENEIWLDDLILANVAFESDGTPHAIDLNGIMALAADRSSEEEEFTKEWITNVECYPNPTYDVLNFRIQLKEDSKTQILIFDQLGRSLIKEEMSLSKGEQVVKFNNLNTWANGLYYYTVKTNDAIFSGTFIKAPDR